MPPHSEPAEGTPAYWLRRAHSTLALASMSQPPAGTLPADLCFLAQQAAEKALKGALVAYRGGFPHIHSIEALLLELPLRLVPPTEVQAAVDLTKYAVQERYEGCLSDVTFQHVDDAVRSASAVVAWAEQIIADANR